MAETGVLSRRWAPARSKARLSWCAPLLPSPRYCRRQPLGARGGFSRLTYPQAFLSHQTPRRWFRIPA